MKLYLVRHGEALSTEINPDSPLTDKGRKDLINTAEFFKKAGIVPDVIWHSIKTRTKETADIFSKILLPKEGVEQKEGLVPHDSIKKILDEILSVKKDVMIVSHLPFLQELTSVVLLNSTIQKIVKFKPASVVTLEKDEEDKWELIFMIIPELLKNAY